MWGYDSESPCYGIVTMGTWLITMHMVPKIPFSPLVLTIQNPIVTMWFGQVAPERGING